MRTYLKFYTYIFICFAYLIGTLSAYSKSHAKTFFDGDSMSVEREKVIVDAFVEAGNESLKKLMEQNAINDEKGESDKNSYIFGFEQVENKLGLNPPITPYVFAKQTAFSVVSLEPINVQLRLINADLAARNKPLVYLGIDQVLGYILTNVFVDVTKTYSYKDFEEASEKFKTKSLDINSLHTLYVQIFDRLHVDTDVFKNSYGMEIMGYGEFKDYFVGKEITPESIPTLENSTSVRTFVWSSFRGYDDNGWADKDINRFTVYDKISKSPLSVSINDISSYYIDLADNIKKTLLNTKPSPVTGKFMKDLYEATGSYYGKLGTGVTREMVEKVNDLIEEMMDDALYRDYIKPAVNTKTSTGTLTKADLENMEKALRDLRQACQITYNETSAAYMTTFLNYLSRCQNYNGSCIGEGGADGYIPQCIWDNPTAPYPVAFSCGLIDGAIGTVAGIGELAVGVVKFQVFLECWKPWSPSFYFDESCKETREKTIVHFKQCWEVVNDWDNFKNVVNVTYTTLTNELGKWSNNTFCTDRACCYYNMGKAVFDIGSLFFGIGELKAVSKGFKLSSYASEFGQLSTQLFTKTKIFNNAAKLTKTGSTMAFEMSGKRLFRFGSKESSQVLRRSTKLVDRGTKVTFKKSQKILSAAQKSSATDAYIVVKNNPNKLIGTFEVEEFEVAEEILEEIVTNPKRKGAGKIKLYDLLVDNEEYFGVANETLGGNSPADELIGIIKKLPDPGQTPQPNTPIFFPIILLDRDDPDPDCAVCETKSVDIKTKYETLCKKARAAGLDEKLVKLALNNMCNNLSDIKLLAMYNRLIEEDLSPQKFNSLKLKEFLSDLVIKGSTCATRVPYPQGNVAFEWIGLASYLSQLDTPMLDAWLIYYAAERPCLRQSLPHLSSLSEAYLNANLKKTPFNFTFDDFKKTSIASGGQASRSNESDAEVFTNLRILADKNLRYRNSQKFGLKENLISAGFYQVVGANFVMRYINNNTAEFINKFVTIEDTTRFSEVQKDFRVTDVKTIDPTNQKTIYYEFKSYRTPPSGNFCNQWIRDLGLAQNATELKWIFDGRRIANNDMTILKDAQLNELITTKSITKFNDSNRLPNELRVRWFAITDPQINIDASKITQHFNSLFPSIFTIF